MTSPVALLLGTPVPEGTEQAAAQGGGGDLFAGALAAALAVTASEEAVSLPLSAVPDAPADGEAQQEGGEAQVSPDEQEAAPASEPDRAENAASAAFPVVALLVQPMPVDADAPEVQMPDAPLPEAAAVVAGDGTDWTDGADWTHETHRTYWTGARRADAPATARQLQEAADGTETAGQIVHEPSAKADFAMEQEPPATSPAAQAPVSNTGEPFARNAVRPGSGADPIIPVSASEPAAAPTIVEKPEPVSAPSQQPQAVEAHPESKPRSAEVQARPGQPSSQGAEEPAAAPVEAPLPRHEHAPAQKEHLPQERHQEQQGANQQAAQPLAPEAPQQSAPQVQAQAPPVVAAAPAVTPTAPVVTEVSAKPSPITTSTDAATLEQVVTGAKLAVSSKATDLTVQLDPPGLGRLHVKVTLAGGEISARLSADNPATYNLIASHQADIRESLGQAGLRLDQLTVLDFGAASQGFDRRGHSSGGSYPGNNPSAPSFYWQQQLTADDSLTAEQPGFGRINYLA